MHHHPKPHVVNVKNEARIESSFPDGQEEIVDLKAGPVLGTGAGAHEAVHIGNALFNNVVVAAK